MLMALALVVSIAGCSGEQSSQVADEVTQPIETTQQSSSGGSTPVYESKPEEEEPEAPKYQIYASMTAEEITASLTLEQKAAQMVQPVIYMLDPNRMAENCYGSILGKNSSVTYDEWQVIADVLCGGAEFTGRLPSPWYGSVDRIGTDECMFEQGYGLSY